MFLEWEICMNKRMVYLWSIFLLLSGLSMRAEDLQSVSGRIYPNIKINRITGKGIEIFYTGGISTVRFEDLPEEFLQRHPNVRKKFSEVKKHQAKPAETAKPAKTETAESKPEDLEAYKRRIYEEELSKLTFQKLFQPAPPADPKIQPDIMQNLLFVNGENGAGTAFKMQFGQLPVIVTNAHVFLGLRDPVIRDIKGRCYKILSVYGAKQRDLVIMTYRRKKDEAPLLRLMKDFSSIQVNSKITAYGNSQGSQTHSVLPGSLLGLGYDRMEVSCGIVGGNSGGPVLLDKSREVIGVSTFLTIREVDLQAVGTRYEGKKGLLHYNIRRYASRIDNLTPDMLEILKAEKLEKERKYFALSEKIQEEVSGHLRNYRLDSMKICLNSYTEDLLQIDKHQWTSSYLKQEYLKKRRFLGAIYQILNEGDPVLVTRLRKIWNQTQVNVRKKTVANSYRICSRCHGSGQIFNSQQPSVGSSGLSKIRRSNAFSSANSNKTCPDCSGLGKIRNSQWNHSNAPTEYILPESSVAEFRTCIQKAKDPFNGFFLGEDQQAVWGRFPYYKSNSKLESSRADRLERIYVFRGNHRVGNVQKTRLTYMFNLLMRVELFIPYSEQTASSYTKLLRKEFKEQGDVFQVKMQRMGSTLHLDCRHNAYSPLMDLSANPQQGQGPLL